MTKFAFAPPPQPSLAIAGEAVRFPIRRIFCVGRNYAAHAREMGKDPERDLPFFFMKPADAAVDAPVTIAYPPQTSDFHYEIELVAAIGTGGSDIPASHALDHVFGYGVGIDLTRRDLQSAAKDAGRPWDWAKGFDHSAPISPLHRAATVGHPTTGRIWLAVNDVVKQNQDIADMIWALPEIIALASQSMRLMPGDLFMTGTPAGIGPIVKGDRVTGGIDRLGDIAIDIG